MRQEHVAHGFPAVAHELDAMSRIGEQSPEKEACVPGVLPSADDGVNRHRRLQVEPEGHGSIGPCNFLPQTRQIVHWFPEA